MDNAVASPAVAERVKMRVKDLNFYYGKFHALKNINLDIAEKKVTASEHSVIAYHVSLLLGVSKTSVLARYGGSVVTTTLRRGSTGDKVKALQKKLGIAADGIFGPKTEAAVKAYQKKMGLTVDGIAGPQTLGKLGL